MGALTLTDSRKRFHHAPLISCIGKGENGFAGHGFDLVKVEDLMPAKKQKVTPSRVVSEPVSSFQSPQRSIATNTITSRKPRLPPPAPLPREVHGPQRSLKYMSSTSSSLKQWGGASAVGKGSVDIFMDSKENYMANESRLVEARRQALEFVSGTRRDKTVIRDFAQCSKGVHAKSDKAVSSSKFLTAGDRLAECLDVENYRRMVDGRLSDSTHKESFNAPVCMPQKSLDVAIVNLDDDSQPSTPVMPGSISLHNKDDATGNMGKPVISSAVDLEQKKPAYRVLQESIDEKLVPALRNINIQIKLEEAKYAAINQIRKLTKPVEEDQFHKPFAPLTAEEEEEVSIALNGSNRRECLVMHESSNIEITRNVLQCLLPGAWLNDEVINLNLELLKEREARNPKQFLRCHFFNTFFYKKNAS